jgi:hypothetical protein
MREETPKKKDNLLGIIVGKAIESPMSAYLSPLKKIFLAALTLLWLPLPFFGFDSHHDGLILSTIRLNLDALHSGGAYPFNQYGPFWTIPFVLIGQFVPGHLLFIVLRIVTVLCYFLTARLLWKIGLMYGGVKVAYWAVAFFMLSQPFVSNYGSALTPWPSAVAMPMATAITFLALKLMTNQEQSLWRTRFDLIFMGSLLPLLILTRVQVGAAILFVSVLSLFLMRASKRFLFFLLGLTISSAGMAIYLSSHGWLISALSDEFVFGSLYVRGDTSTYPNPIFTALGTLFFLLLFFAVPWIRSLVNTSSYQNLKYYALGLTLVLLFGSGLFLAHRQLAILPITVIISRRFWISIVLAALIFFLFSKVTTVLEERKKGVSEPRSRLLLLLVMFALASQSQGFPQFDQMHFWWGAPISFLILTLVVQDRFGELHVWSRKITVVISALFVVVTVLFPWVSQITGDYKRMPNAVISFIWDDPLRARSAAELQNFFSDSFRKDERVLNLCRNSDVFFKEGFVKPAARAFVLWPSVLQVKDLRASILESHPDAILICASSKAIGIQNVQKTEQIAILNIVYPKSVLVSRHTGSSGEEWTIYRAVP